MNAPSDLSLFFGRMHPLFVHLPIGLICLVAALELLARFRRFKDATSAAGYVLAFAAPAAVATAVCGWLLSRAGGYNDSLLQWHKWTGIATAGVCVFAALLYRLDLKKVYRWCLFAGTATLVVTSHFGGSLTHGSDYLTRYAPPPLRGWLGGGQPVKAANTAAVDPAKAPAFVALVQPILNDKCVMCHGPEKSKGGLRLDSYAEAIKGGDSGAAIVPGSSTGSLVVKRLLLSEEDENHMPPDGKPQPSADDLALLRWWIDTGASADAKAADLKPNAVVTRILSTRGGGSSAAPGATASPPGDTTPSASVPASSAPVADFALAEKLASELHVALSPLSATEPWLQCNAHIAGTNFGDAQLAKLAPLGACLRWLDLADTRVTDSGLNAISTMTNLVRLHLERNAVGDQGLEALGSLTALEYLNLYGTAVTDAGLESLKKLPHLKQLYLWQTKVTSTGLQAFVESRTDRVQIQQWQDEVRQLESRIRDARMTAEVGVPTSPDTNAAAPTASAAPVNTQCPVSGKPVNPAKTVALDGRVIAFCCDDCKAQFQKDPKPFLAKLDTPGQKNK